MLHRVEKFLGFGSCRYVIGGGGEGGRDEDGESVLLWEAATRSIISFNLGDRGSGPSADAA